MTVHVSLAQINATVGDLAGNRQRIVDAARTAHAAGADILVTPELALTGYPPEDLLLRPAFLDQAARELTQLATELAAFPGLSVIVGHPLSADGHCYNAASLLRDGATLGSYRKRELPNYGVFDERRYFVPDGTPFVFDVKGITFGINICEDTWFAEAPQAAARAGAQVLLVPNASPYEQGKRAARLEIVRRHAPGLAVVYVNLVGGQDELVFDGASFVLDADGVQAVGMPAFETGVLTVAFDGARPQPQPLPPVLAPEAEVYHALMLGVRDYLGKTGFREAVIGLSGGLDSALVLAIAVDALGADRVRAVMMPSPYTADISLIDARDIATRLGVQYDEIRIEPAVAAFNAALAGMFSGLPPDATEENIQARVRGTLLMAMSNKFGSIVLTTGNKSELTTGYCTLYGDMAGGFAVIKDVAKTLAYRLARWRNLQGDTPVIPERILTRAPSAELRPDQTDQDSLPPYEVLDDVMHRYMECNQSLDDILAAGHAREDVLRVVKLLRINEYKRRQAPIGVRITGRAYGRDWRYPIASRFNENIESAP